MRKILVLAALAWLAFSSASAFADDNYSNVICLPSVAVNMKATSATQLLTTENGTRSFHVSSVRITAASSSAITIPATMSVGTNATSYNNVVSTTLLASLLNSGFDLPISLAAASANVPPNTAIYANISIAATGTAQTGVVYVCGYYQSP